MRGFSTALLGLLAAVTSTTTASALEIKTAPETDIYVAEANARRGFFDLMVQTIIIHNDATTPITLTGMQLNILGPQGRITTKTVSGLHHSIFQPIFMIR